MSSAQTQQLIDQAHASLKENFEPLPVDVESTVKYMYQFAFPIAVFGTLRQIPRPMGNTQRMYAAEPVAVQKGFVEHCTFTGIHADFKENASGAVEVFFHQVEDFKNVIPGVDRLEGFSAGSGRNHWCYHRTLMRVRLLPDDHSNELFDRGLSWDDRDLGIPKEEWESFPWVPAWIYTNGTANNAMMQTEENPVIYFEG